MAIRELMAGAQACRRFINWLIASEGQASLYGQSEVRERFLFSEQPLFDIGRLFELWPQTIGIQDYPMPEIQGLGSRDNSQDADSAGHARVSAAATAHVRYQHAAGA